MKDKNKCVKNMTLLDRIRAIVDKIPDPWNDPRTRLWNDGTYMGDGHDLIACRDAVHDIKKLFDRKQTKKKIV